MVVGPDALPGRADGAGVVVQESLSGRAGAVRVIAAVGAGAFGRLHPIDSGRDPAGKGPVPGAVRPKLSLVVITVRLRKLRRVAKHFHAGRLKGIAGYAASAERDAVLSVCALKLEHSGCERIPGGANRTIQVRLS